MGVGRGGGGGKLQGVYVYVVVRFGGESACGSAHASGREDGKTSIAPC